ncbi:MAG: STAS domain-containing protein [bacterium]|nr:STAS domain-containing protein [bacterium]
MKVKRIPQGDVTVLEVSGKIMGGPDFDMFKGEVKELLDSGCKKVVLDLGEVPWINSTGLGILITAHHSIKAAAGVMKVCNVKERVLSIFYVSQLERVFEVHPDRETAVASFQ